MSGSGCCRRRRGTSGNYRAYSQVLVQQLGFVRRARNLGFTIEEIRELLSLSDQKDRSCEAVDAIARDHLADVERKIVDLAALRQELDSIIGQCGCGTIAECGIIEALSPIAVDSALETAQSSGPQQSNRRS